MKKEKETVVKPRPVQFDNVTMQNRQGQRLTGVCIRPEIQSSDGVERFVSDNFYVSSMGTTEEGKKLDAFIRLETLANILAGEKVNIGC